MGKIGFYCIRPRCCEVNTRRSDLSGRPRKDDSYSMNAKKGVNAVEHSRFWTREAKRHFPMLSLADTCADLPLLQMKGASTTFMSPWKAQLALPLCSIFWAGPFRKT